MSIEKNYVGRLKILLALPELAEAGILNEKMSETITIMEEAEYLDETSELIVEDVDNSIVTLKANGLKITTF